MKDNDKALQDLQDGHGGYNADLGQVSSGPYKIFFFYFLHKIIL